MSAPLVFFQSRFHAWHFSTVRQPEKLVHGAKFQCIYAPFAAGMTNRKHWSRTRFRVGTWFNPALKKYERVYFDEYTKHYDEMPLLEGETVVETFGIEAAITIK